MKILLATYWAIPHLGGVWNYMVQTKGYLEALGHEVDMLGYGADNTFIHLVNKDRRVKKEDLMPVLHANINPETYPEIFANKLVEYTEFQRYCYELGAACLGLDGYDIIHTQDVIATSCISRVKPPETPLVATLHGSVAHEIRHQLKTIHKSPNSYMAKAYYDELESMGGHSSDLTIVANNWLKNILEDEFAIPSEQLKVMHYGYNILAFDSGLNERTDVVKPEGKKVIMFSGRLVELKGVQYLLEALAKLRKSNRDWVCWIAGDGEIKRELVIQSKVLGLGDSVKFLGVRDDLPALLKQSDIFVLPSLIENQPLSLIEAQLAGNAIAVSDVGGLPEMVEDGVTGLLFPTSDSDKLTDVLLDLVTDDELRTRLGTAAKEWARVHWDLATGIRKLTDVYESLIKKS
ncbi:glycosyltransferase family 1 protein [Bacillus sp. FJAT-42376]|uniref:glycosyltransferase family 4 protein n=1 Tax=Bacillus sp. FJAT-42376 TaxID=2014076 RepID=UPI000F4F9C48|nr:glycosyltransferase family 4 protein [Bacillus sp. FJAT-42376]AZB43228.1 glycosyltransferase family 1 protein [Bacillus sp. FJAT-42376]